MIKKNCIYTLIVLFFLFDISASNILHICLYSITNEIGTNYKDINK